MGAGAARPGAPRNIAPAVMIKQDDLFLLCEPSGEAPAATRMASGFSAMIAVFSLLALREVSADVTRRSGDVHLDMQIADATNSGLAATVPAPRTATGGKILFS